MVGRLDRLVVGRVADPFVQRQDKERLLVGRRAAAGSPPRGTFPPVADNSNAISGRWGSRRIVASSRTMVAGSSNVR